MITGLSKNIKITFELFISETNTREHKLSSSGTHQQRHDELVQVNHLDAAYIQLHSAISFGGVGITGALCGVRSQTHGEAEHLITHDGDGLNDSKSSTTFIQPDCSGKEQK